MALAAGLLPFLVTLGLTETKQMLVKRLNAMKLIKANSTKRMVLATAVILTVGALSVLPWRLTAQEPAAGAGASTGASPPGAAAVQPPGNAQPQADDALEPPARQFGPRGSGGFGGGGMPGGRSSFAAALQSSSPPPTNVAPARFEATVYELDIPENRIAELDAATLEASAATPQSLAAALGAFGTPKVLYKVDQTVNLYGENITLGTQEPTVSGTTMNPRGMRVNSLMYQNVGLITRIAADPRSAERNAMIRPFGGGGMGGGGRSSGGPGGPGFVAPDVQLNFQLSVIAKSGVEIADGVSASSVRTVALSQSGTPRFGKPSVLVTVSAAGAGEKSLPVAYIIRYLFTQPKP